MRNHLIALGALALIGAAPAFAAGDGTLGATSTGTTVVRATVSAPPQAVASVTGLEDFNFGDVTNIPSILEYADQICIYHTSPTVQLQLVPPSGLIQLLNTQGDFLPIEFRIFQGTEELVGGTRALQFLTRNGLVANRASPTCTSGPTQRIEVRTVAPPSGQAPGNYTGTFQIIVSVE